MIITIIIIIIIIIIINIWLKKLKMMEAGRNKSVATMSNLPCTSFLIKIHIALRINGSEDGQ